MMVTEFEKMVGEEIGENDWSIITIVYSYYPGIDNVEGKEQIKALWKQFGIVIFWDMYQRATQIRNEEKKIATAQKEVQVLRGNYKP